MRRRSRRANSDSSGPLSSGPFRLGRSGVHLITVGLVVLSLWSLSNFVGQVITGAQLERRKEEVQAEVARIEAENAALKQRVVEAESPAYAERIAREQLGFAREGDTVVLPTFPEHTPVPIAPTTAPLPTPTPQSNWRGWVRAFFPGDETP